MAEARITHPHRSRRVPGRLALVALALLLAGAVGAPAPAAPSLPPRQPLWSAGIPGAMGVAVLTRDGPDSYLLDTSGGGVRVRGAESNTAGDTRVALYRRGTPSVVDGESCATWGDRSGDIIQLGAALRVTRDDAVVRAITITHNIWVSPFAFNIHTWDTSRPGLPADLVAQVDMSDRFFGYGLPALPWHFCARTVGDTVAFKVWASTEAEPAWGDAIHSAEAQLPDGWVYPGQVGWYVGHLRAGDTAQLDGLSTWTYSDQQPMVPRPPAPDAPPPTVATEPPPTRVTTPRGSDAGEPGSTSPTPPSLPEPVDAEIRRGSR